MKRQIETKTLRCLLMMVGGTPADSIEAAKQLIGSPAAHMPIAALIDIARSSSFREWPRVAAIYALGMSKNSKPSLALRRLSLDVNESTRIRSHALEALGNMGDRKAISAARAILRDGSSAPVIKRSARYALNQIEGATATSDQLSVI